MGLIFGIAGAVVAAYALWTRLHAVNPAAAGELADRIHVQTNVLVRVASLVHAVISLFAGLRPASLPSAPRGPRMVMGRRVTTFGKPAYELEKDDGDDDDD